MGWDGVRAWWKSETNMNDGGRGPGGPRLQCGIPGGRGGVGGGATLRPKIFNTFFYDTSLLIGYNNTLLSHLTIS